VLDKVCKERFQFIIEKKFTFLALEQKRKALHCIWR